jgi:choline-sulfatase
MMFDLARDPLEQNDLARDSSCGVELASFIAEAESRWDLGALHADVLQSQRRRRLVHEALVKGRIAPWDYEPRQDAANAYYRNYGADLPDPDAILRRPKRA